jgi:hypothetical protein
MKPPPRMSEEEEPPGVPEEESPSVEEEEWYDRPPTSPLSRPMKPPPSTRGEEGAVAVRASHLLHM